MAEEERNWRFTLGFSLEVSDISHILLAETVFLVPRREENKWDLVSEMHGL
jgi:hypothetical protein